MSAQQDDLFRQDSAREFNLEVPYGGACNDEILRGDVIARLPESLFDIVG